MDERIIVITDLHGCYDEMTELLDKVNFDPQIDRLLCLGDMIDRGPKIFLTFEYMKKLQKMMGDRCVLLRGNHEQLLVDYLRGGNVNRRNWDMNGGTGTRFDFIMNKHRVQEFGSWFDSLPFYCADPRFTGVHASMEDEDPAKNDIWTLIWGRSTDYEGHLILTGHTPYRYPVFFCGHEVSGQVEEDRVNELPEKGMFGLDTGCVYGNRLSCMVVTGRRFYITSVEAKKRWYTKRKEMN